VTPAELVARLASGLSVDDALAMVHPDAAIQPFGSERIYRGIDEIRAYAAQGGSGEQTVAISVVEKGDDAVVFGQAGVSRQTGEGSTFTQWVPAAWVVGTRDGKLARVTPYRSWTEAAQALGLTSEERKGARRLGGGFMRMVRSAVAARRPLHAAPTW
jgi:ketosteroid isomerase-like protein